MNHRIRWWTACATLAAGLVLAAFFWANHGDPPLASLTQSNPADVPPTPAVFTSLAPPPDAAAPPERANVLEQPQASQAWPRALTQRLAATSLRGSAPDGQIRFAAQGRLQVDAELRRHLEWWLSLLGEISLPEIRQWFGESLLGLDDAQRRSALDFFDRWVDYLRAADAALPDGSTTERLDALSALRRQWFGDAAAEALFGDEERYTHHVLSRRALLQDTSLSAEQRAAALADLAQQLSPEQRQMRAQTVDPLLLSEQTAQFEQLNISPDRRHAERAALVGEAAANRLAQLDLQRQDWDQRMAALRAAASDWPSMEQDAAAREARLQAWLDDQEFTEAEQRRARALLALPEGTH